MDSSLAHRARPQSNEAARQPGAAMRFESDRNSFDRQVLEQLPAALRFATKLTGDAAWAEEIVQEALVRAARSWRTFRGDSELRTWLMRIVVNAFRDQLPRRQEPEQLNESLADMRADDPLRSAEAAEQGRLVAAAISSLPPRQREVLVLVTYEQMSAAEAARVLEMTESNVRANLSYARATLKKLLARYRDEP